MPVKKTINQQKKDALKKILRFYNDKGNWVSPSKGFAFQYDPAPSPLEKDNGKLAALGIKLMNAKDIKEIKGLLYVINERLNDVSLNTVL